MLFKFLCFALLLDLLIAFSYGILTEEEEEFMNLPVLTGEKDFDFQFAKEKEQFERDFDLGIKNINAISKKAQQDSKRLSEKANEINRRTTEYDDLLKDLKD